MEESILVTVRSKCDVYETDSDFDPQLITDINMAFGTLYQLGIGPKSGFRITGEEETWSQFMADDSRLELVKDYVCKRTKMAFDPPSSSVLNQALASDIAELEWRISVMPDIMKLD